MSSVNTNSTITNGSTSQQPCDLTDSIAVKICRILALVVVMLTSLVGNSLIIIVVYRHKEFRRTINYFIVNMAISDFMLHLTGIPWTIIWTILDHKVWLVGETIENVACKLSMCFHGASVAVSVQSLVWIAGDRFIAVVFPMKVHLISSKVRSVIIASTWILAAVATSPTVFLTTSCTTNTFTPYQIIFHSILLIMPLFMITILYSVIAVTLRRQSKILARDSTIFQQQDDKKKRAVKMSCCIVVALYICYLPYLPFLVMSSNLFVKTVVSCSFYKIYSPISSFMLYLSATVNPIICFTFIGGYRRGLKQMLHFCCVKEVKLNREIVKQEQITLKEIRHTDERYYGPATVYKTSCPGQLDTAL